jgi:hypothetical protein
MPFRQNPAALAALTGLGIVIGLDGCDILRNTVSSRILQVHWPKRLCWRLRTMTRQGGRAGRTKEAGTTIGLVRSSNHFAKLLSRLASDEDGELVATARAILSERQARWLRAIYANLICGETR